MTNPVSKHDVGAEASGYFTTSIPKPIIDHLGKGKEIVSLEFAIKGSRVELRLPEN